MKVVIIEDEELAATSLEKLLLKSTYNIDVIAHLESVEEATEWLANNKCDIIFSDIHLGDGESFEIFENLQITVPIIFTTAFDRYAIKSFKYFAIDYLLKPYDAQKLDQAIKKYKDVVSLPEIYQQKMTNLFLEMNSIKKTAETQERFLINNGKQLISIESKEISFFRAQGKHLFLHDVNGDNYLYSDTILGLEQKLSHRDFFKVNRNYIIKHSAIKNIYEYSNNRLKIELHFALDKNEIILVSAKVKKKFKAWLSR
ncbi:LytR/AlgR family response regulator transcription factor [Flavivirga spongiicola]|uniref:LytTR family DNA-binding domain-containing protein n=1 Tax=Flavivirga spongiicola TaxID=421621 RepID=A0ABU7XLU6_9FLAO|nr:LytTR family DNA-binding domain-containing protein [Flavivirga sp. MEBiC05379]MDO5981385.1 LytTR family DNA-binding domain-containing protein [Flavivirga sp. MEBiC05379]